MDEAVKIRVTRDGNKTRFQLVVDGEAVREMTRSEVLALALNATSAMRWTWNV